MLNKCAYVALSDNGPHHGLAAMFMTPLMTNLANVHHDSVGQSHKFRSRSRQNTCSNMAANKGEGWFY